MGCHKVAYSRLICGVFSLALMKRCGEEILLAYSSATSCTMLKVVGILNLKSNRMTLYLSVYLSACLSVYLSFYLSICLS